MISIHILLLLLSIRLRVEPYNKAVEQLSLTLLQAIENISELLSSMLQDLLSDEIMARVTAVIRSLVDVIKAVAGKVDKLIKY
jgi:hypothetical protein